MISTCDYHIFVLAYSVSGTSLGIPFISHAGFTSCSTHWSQVILPATLPARDLSALCSLCSYKRRLVSIPCCRYVRS